MIAIALTTFRKTIEKKKRTLVEGELHKLLATWRDTTWMVGGEVFTLARAAKKKPIVADLGHTVFSPQSPNPPIRGIASLFGGLNRGFI
jgi:hypothetical protein